MTATARPVALEVRPADIPAVLKARPQWVAWEYEHRQGKWTKIPICIATGGHADSTDPATWATFDAALKAYQGRGYAGIGYVFSAGDPYCGIDFDKCMTPGVDSPPLSTAVRTILAELDSYTEETPSETGLHVIVEASLPGGKGRKNTRLQIEMYDRGRFFTMTGQAFPLSPATPQPRQEALDDLYARLFPVRPVGDAPPPRPQGLPPPDDQALIDRAHRARNAANFARLWRGDTSGHHDDDSSADLALCNHLAFWAGPDPARIDRLFRASGLYRTKWERASYREPTIARALAGRTEFYAWGERGESDGATFAVTGDDPADAVAGAPAPSANPNDYDLTDTGNGELFAALYVGQFRHDHRRGKWYRWVAHWWRGESDRHARLQTKTVARARMRAAAEIEDETRRKAALAWAKVSQSKAKRDALLSHAADETPLAADEDDWDTEPYLLGVANGVVDLHTGQLYPGSPADYITLHAPVPYDPRAAAPRWEQFLREVFEEDQQRIDWLQRMIGYSLTGDISEHAFVVCFGVGANGKSTLFTLLGQLLGDYAGTLNFSALAHTRYESHPTELAALVGKRFVTASELNEGQRLNEARIKGMTGGDAIKARFMRQDEFEFRPVLKLWLAVNHRPIIRDDSRGFWRRMHLLPFRRTFPIDNTLQDALRAESPGILAWAIRGCLAWQAGGLGTADAITDATREYREESDPLTAFLAECCAVGDHLVSRANTLYKAYEEWSNDQGQREGERLTSTTFGRRAGERFIKQRDGNGNFYKGVALSAAWQEREARPPRFAPD